jgi:hypothetical protein
MSAWSTVRARGSSERPNGTHRDLRPRVQGEECEGRGKHEMTRWSMRSLIHETVPR